MKCLVFPIIFLCLLGCQNDTHNNSKTKINSNEAIESAETSKKLVAQEPEIKTIIFVCTWGFDKSVIASSYFNEVLKDKGFHYKAISRASKISKRNINNSIPTAVLIDILSTGLTLQSSNVIQLSEDDINSAYKIIYLDTPSEVVNENNKEVLWDNIPPIKVGVDKTTAIIKEKVDKLVKEIG